MTAMLSQDQLFTYYMYCCGKNHVYKPNKEVLLLLESKLINNDRQKDCVNSTCTDSIWENSTFVPLAKRKLFRLEPGTNSVFNEDVENTDYMNSTENENKKEHLIHVGARGMLALLDLLVALPQLEEIDLSNITSWYVADAFTCHNEFISGNDVVHKLCMVLPALYKVRKVDINNQPIGTLAADMLYHTIDKCERLTEIKFDRSGVDRQLTERIEWKLNSKGSVPHVQYAAISAAAAAAATTTTSPPSLASRITKVTKMQKKTSKAAITSATKEEVESKTLFDYYQNDNDDGVMTLETQNEQLEIAPNVLETILRLPFTDRKTTYDQHTLRAVLSHDVNFSHFLTESEMEELILHTSVISTNAAATLCGTNGLRGDNKHLFILKDGAIDVRGQISSYVLRRGDYFGDRYDNELIYPSGQLVERERGHVFCVPLEYCTSLLREWSNRVRELYYSFVRYIPILQGVDCWSRIRMCTCAEVLTFHERTIVIAAEESHNISDKDNRERIKHTLLRSNLSSNLSHLSCKGHEKLEYGDKTHLQKLHDCTNTSPLMPLPTCAIKMSTGTNQIKADLNDTETLYFVQHGTFYATASNNTQKGSHTLTNILPERKCAASIKVNSIEKSDNIKSNKNSVVNCKKLYTFTSGECFGEEIFVSAHKSSSVNIIAEPETTKFYDEHNNEREGSANNTTNFCKCLKVNGSAVRVLLSQLLPVFRASTACYTQHGDEKNNYDIVRAKKAKQASNNKAMYFT